MLHQEKQFPICVPFEIWRLQSNNKFFHFIFIKPFSYLLHPVGIYTLAISLGASIHLLVNLIQVNPTAPTQFIKKIHAHMVKASIDLQFCKCKCLVNVRGEWSNYFELIGTVTPITNNSYATKVCRRASLKRQHIKPWSSSSPRWVPLVSAYNRKLRLQFIYSYQKHKTKIKPIWSTWRSVHCF